jgi:hypothetical protein
MSKAIQRGDLLRLLGPAGSELGCDECFEQLDRYVELELSGADPEAEIPGMRAHLQGCSACAEDHDSLHALLLAEDAPGRG